MARGTWEDFTDKYGFGDGSQLESRDFAARANLVNLLNEQPEFKKEGIRALAFDRAGFHNCCLIVLAKAIEGKTDDELLKMWLESDGEEPELPEMDSELDELIAEAYDNASSKD
jgi:hypothetical protein